MSKYDVIIMIIILIIVTSILGGVFGYTVNGVPSHPDEDTNILVDGIVFFYSMMSFQIDNMPIYVGAVFWVLSLLSLYLLYNALRGNG